MIFFSTSQFETLADLKKEYRRLAMIHHPDHGGTNEAFRMMNDEYKSLLKTNNYSPRQRKIMDAVEAAAEFASNLPGVTVEIINLWVWVYGNTFENKDTLKEYGFKFAPKKKAWTFAGVPSTGSGASMFAIRFKYGSRIIKRTAYLD